MRLYLVTINDLGLISGHPKHTDQKPIICFTCLLNLRGLRAKVAKLFHNVWYHLFFKFFFIYDLWPHFFGFYPKFQLGIRQFRKWYIIIDLKPLYPKLYPKMPYKPLSRALFSISVLTIRFNFVCATPPTPFHQFLSNVAHLLDTIGWCAWGQELFCLMQSFYSNAILCE